MNENKKNTVNGNVLVGAGKSSRLDAIRKKTVSPNNNTRFDEKQKPRLVTGLNQQTKEALQQAALMMEERMTIIMNGFPAGKKNTFFKLKYGVDSNKINKMAMKQVFSILHLDSSKNRHFRLIEKLDIKGNRIND